MWFTLVRIVAISLGLISTYPVTAYDGTCGSPAEVADLPARHWCEVPNSRLRSAEKRPQDYPDWNGSQSFQYESFQRVQGVFALVGSWNSAAFDSRRNRLLTFGGGHNDYGGNEIYAFDLRSLRWTRVSDPTAFPSRHPEFQNSDGTPVSRHTYGGLEYISHLDEMFVYDGAPDHGPGTCGVSGTWTFDLDAREQQGSYQPGQWNLRTSSGEPPGACDNTSAYDPVTERLFFYARDGWWAFEFASNQWIRVNTDGRTSEQVNVAIDPVARRLVAVGGGQFIAWDLTNVSLPRVSIGAGGSISGTDDPGVAFDLSTNQLIAWRGGTTVHALSPQSMSWSSIQADSGNSVNPGSVTASGGVFGRFRYSRDFNVFMYVDSVDKNVFLYRLSDGQPVNIPRPPTIVP